MTILYFLGIPHANGPSVMLEEKVKSEVTVEVTNLHTKTRKKRKHSLPNASALVSMLERRR